MYFPPFLALLGLLILISPVALLVGVLIVGVRKRRRGMIIAPLFIAGFVAGCWLTFNWHEMRQLSGDVAKLDLREFASARGRHDLIVLEDIRRGGNHSTDCDSLCQQILASSDHRVGVPGRGSEPLVYRKVSDAECTATWYTARNIRFAGFCARIEQSHVVDDGLLIMTPATYVDGGTSPWQWFADLPTLEFSGEAFALVERIPGEEERMLGRWVAGEVAVWPFHSGPIGQSFDRAEFYSAALGLRLK